MMVFFSFQLAMATVMVKECRCQILTYISEMSFSILIKSLPTMLEYQYLCLVTPWLVEVPLKSPTGGAWTLGSGHWVICLKTYEKERVELLIKIVHFSLLINE